MKAQVLEKPAPVDSNPLRLMEVERPTPGPQEALVQVLVCGVCHTDLHVTEGELPNPTLPIIPGHQIVGKIVENGSDARRFPVGTRVGIPWLHQACGHCEYCRRGQENLCE